MVKMKEGKNATSIRVIVGFLALGEASREQYRLGGTRYQTEHTATIRWKGQEALLSRKRSTNFNGNDALTTAARRVHDTEISRVYWTL